MTLRFTVEHPVGQSGCAPELYQQEGLAAFVRAAEEAGFDAVAFTEHPAPSLKWLQAGGHESLDPLTALAFAAAVTSRITLMTYLLVLPYRNPLMTAKMIATVDLLSQGRLVVGAGGGYLRSEFFALGVDFDERGALFDEAIDVIRALWSGESLTFEGRHFTARGQVSTPAPVQRPHPPIWIGAQSIAGARRAGRIGDAYPVTPEATADEIAERFDVVREGFAARGKPFGPQPLRRNVLVADSREEAIVEYARVAKGKYLSYAQKGMTVAGSAEKLDEDFLATVGEHAVLGSDAEVIAQLTELCTRFPVDPLLLRPQWPSMSADETIAAIERLGKEVVPAIRALPTPQPEPVPAAQTPAG